MSSSSYQPLSTSDEGGTVAPPKPPPPSRAFHLRSWLVASVILLVTCTASYKAGQWSVLVQEQSLEPTSTSTTSVIESVSITSTASSSTPTTISNDTDMYGEGKKSVGYFVNWGIYGRKFPPSLIPVQDLTHILYAFANVNSGSGEVILSDLWADQDIHYPSDSWNDVGKNLYGNFKQIYLLKKQNRHLKVLLSIGGWTYSPSFHPVVINPAARAKFVESAITLLEDYGLDGLDVDYEYPSNDEQARGYVALLRELRHGLDLHAQKKGCNYRFLLTIAAPCGPDHYKKLHIREMDQVLDFWNLMAYDYAGSWDTVSGHQANVFGGAINGAEAVNWYAHHGVDPSKLILGVPLYGRSFMNTKGPGEPFNGIGPGSWEKGVYDYRALPLPGSYKFRDDKLVASWSLDYDKHEMISYDDEHVGVWKGAWIKQRGLGGSMFWELSGDKGTKREGMEGGPGKEEQPGRSLVTVVKEAMGGLDLSAHNWLGYEGSKFDNMRLGMQ